MKTILTLIILIFNLTLIISQENEKRYTLDNSGKLYIEKEINNINQTDSSTFNLIKKYIIDYYSDDKDIIWSINPENKTFKTEGSFRVDKNGWNTDFIWLNYILDISISNNQLKAKYSFYKYYIEYFNGEKKTEMISSKYPINQAGNNKKKFNYALEKSISEIDLIFTKMAKIVSEKSYINQYTIVPPFKLDKFQGSYIVNLEKDTFPVKIIKHNLSRLVCDSSGLVKKYKAKNILSFINNGKIYDSGKVRDKGLGFTRWIFFHKIISGSLSYYTHVASEKSTQGTLEKRVNSLATSYYYDVHLYFIRLKNDDRGRFRRLGARWRKQFKKTGSDCPDFIKEINVAKYWNPNFTKYVNLYNGKCGNK